MRAQVRWAAVEALVHVAEQDDPAVLDALAARPSPPFPTVAPTHVPTLHSLPPSLSRHAPPPPSLLLPLPMSLLYTPSLHPHTREREPARLGAPRQRVRRMAGAPFS